MRVLELFSGTGSVGKICKELGWECVSLDIEYKATFNIDILEWNYKMYPEGHFDFIWASPPCESFSQLQYSWVGRKLKDGTVVSHDSIKQRELEQGLPPVRRTEEIINYFKPKFFVIENPSNSRIKEYIDYPSYVVDYCAYVNWGYKKRTRLFTNLKTFQPKLCNPLTCKSMDTLYQHDKLIGAKRHKKVCDGGYDKRKHIKVATGSSGKGLPKHTSKMERYRIPPNLIRDIFATALYES